MEATRRRRVLAALLITLSRLPAAVGEGFWKAYTPPEGEIKGEFDNYDPVGLATGAEIKADCSLRWTDPQDGKLYCFASGTSMEMFIDDSRSYLRKALAQWERLHADSAR